MPKIIVTSRNPVKVNAAKQGFESMFPGTEFEIGEMSVPSGVPHQPIGDAQTLQGALNRILAAEIGTNADYIIGIEGGIETVGDEMQTFAWVVVKAADGRVGKGRTGVFYLPTPIAKLVREGHELGTAAEMVFGEEDVKSKQGTVGLLTGNVIDRTAYYHHAVVLALAPFKHPELY